MKDSLLFLSLYFAIILSIFAAGKLMHLKQNGLLSRKRIFNVFDKAIFTFSVTALLVSILFDFNFLQYKAPISHENWQSVTLSDFRGFKRPNMTLHGEAKFAFISTSIRTSKTSKTIAIETLFHPARSYVYNRDLFSTGLLTHEMYHFHITEYYARLMRKEVTESISKGETIQLDVLKKQILEKEQALQLQYDKETDHSYVHGKQIEWQHKIDSILVDLETYSNVNIPLKN